MAKDFDMRAVGPRKLRTTTFCGLVFGTLSEATPPIEDYLGEAIAAPRPPRAAASRSK